MTACAGESAYLGVSARRRHARAAAVGAPAGDLLRGRQQPTVKSPPGAERFNQRCRVRRVIVQNAQVAAESKQRHPVAGLDLAQEIDHVPCGGHLVAPFRVEAVEQNNSDAAGRTGALLQAVGEDVRGQRRDGRIGLVFRFHRKGRDLLRFAIIPHCEIFFCQARHRVALFVQHHYVHLHHAGGGAQHQPRVVGRLLRERRQGG